MSGRIHGSASLFGSRSVLGWVLEIVRIIRMGVPHTDSNHFQATGPVLVQRHEKKCSKGVDEVLALLLGAGVLQASLRLEIQLGIRRWKLDLPGARQ